MSLVADIIARLGAEVLALEERIEGAAELAELVRRDILPQRTPAAYVLSIGDDAEPPATLTGVHRQRVTETVGVVLVSRFAGDATGKRASTELETLREAVKLAIAGWQPAASSDVCSYQRGRLVGMAAGAVFYQVDFSADSYIRV